MTKREPAVTEQGRVVRQRAQAALERRRPRGAAAVERCAGASAERRAALACGLIAVVLGLAACAGAPGGPVVAAPAAVASAASTGSVDLVVRGLDGRARSVSAARLAALPRRSIEAKLHDDPHRYAGVALADVLVAAGVELPDKLRGAGLRRVLLLRAADGYAVAFSAAELDPTIGHREVWLVDRVDDRPLPSDEGPWRLVVPGEGRPTRWLRQLTTIEWHELP